MSAAATARGGELAGKVVLISGAARGQGAAHARRAVAEGADVVLGDVLPLDAVLAELGDRALGMPLDVADRSDWERLVDAAVARFGRVDVLVNNAGVVGRRPSPLAEHDLDNLRHVIDVNVVGTFLGMGVVSNAMPDGGAIVNVSSIMGVRGSPTAAAYAASKWAVRGMTRTAAIEFAARGIRVNTVLPGPVDTPMIPGDRDEALARHSDRLLLGRLGHVDDVVEAVLFLASARSSWITGADLLVDGGWTVR